MVPPFAPGSRIAGYEVVAPLGKGGMGVVLRARDAVGREVALKILPVPDPALRQRFVLEAQAAARVSHPNVARVHAAGEVGGWPFIALELVSGGSLADLLRARGQLPWREAATLGADIARGLDGIHRAGLVHRDLKPANVLLDEGGRAKVTDFGLVRSLDAGRSLTQTGELLGTAEFMAPEQADAAKAVDYRADLYALGATLYALVAGRPPFAGRGFEVLRRVLEEKPPSPRSLARDLPASFEALILALLEKDPEARPRSARAVSVELDALARGEARSAPRRLLAALGALAVLLAAAAFFVRPRVAPRGQDPSVAAVATREDAEELEAAAGVALRAADLERAKARAKRAATLAPGLARAWARLAVACLRLREPDEALEAANRALALDPRLAEALAARAALHADAHEWSEAITVADSALAIDSKAALAHVARGEAIFWRDQEADRRGATKAARDEGGKACRLDENLGRAWALVGLTFWRDDKLVDQPLYGERAMKLEPRNPWGFFLAADGLFRKQDTPDAVRRGAQLIEEAVRLGPREPVIWAEKGVFDHWLSRYDESIAAATKAIELDPKTTQAWLVRALTYKCMKQSDDAVRDADRLLALVPDHAWALWIKGDILRERGELDRAIELLAVAARTDDHYGEAPLSLAKALRQRDGRGDLEFALTYLDKYLSQKDISKFNRERVQALRDEMAKDVDKGK